MCSAAFMTTRCQHVTSLSVSANTGSHRLPRRRDGYSQSTAEMRSVWPYIQGIAPSDIGSVRSEAPLFPSSHLVAVYDRRLRQMRRTAVSAGCVNGQMGAVLQQMAEKAAAGRTGKRKTRQTAVWL